MPRRERVLTPLEEKVGKMPSLYDLDIVLVRINKNFRRTLIRRVTESYWDHAALVLIAKNPAKGYGHDLIIESIAGGVAIHKLDKYLHSPEKYEIGIKRVPNLSKALQKRIKAFMLMNVDAPYEALRIDKFVFALMSTGFSEWLVGRQRYSCSGLIQKAFYEASSWDEREKLIFKDRFESPLELQETTAPADIARSHNARWVYNKH